MKDKNKELKKLHKMYDRLCRIIGKNNADKMIDDVIKKGIIDGEITASEGIEFRKELGIDGD